jgi:phospholipid transport system substrate-binding protein
MMPLRFRFALWVAVLGLILAHPQASAATPASDSIAGLNAKFLDVMKNGETLGYAGRYRELEPILSQTFDFNEMARVSTGRYWNDMTDSQKRAVVDAFEDYSVATYASRFKSFSGQKFEVLGEEPGPRQSVRVNNQIITSSGEPIRIDYLMRDSGGSLKIVDVYLKSSISELATRRSEFGSVLSKNGVESLVATLKKKVGEMEKEGQTASAQ